MRPYPFILSTILFFTTISVSFAQKKETKIFPGRPWNDTEGHLINAHSGGILYKDGYYYWYGEYKIPHTSESKGYTGGGMSCYRSKDLINWTNEGVVLKVDYKNPESDIAYGCIFQRPKVVYNDHTHKYVAFFKLYLKGDGYRVCYTGVATADRPTGPFVYKHKFLAASPVNGSGDFALYKAPNGDLYDFTVRKSDRVFVKAKMTDDYMYPATKFIPSPGVRKSTEAPAIFYKDGIYHLLGSGSSGWKPNAARYYTSTSLDGPWTNQGNPVNGTNPNNDLGPDKTFGGQSTYILPVQGKENAYVAMFDIWKPKNPIQSRYIWLPFRVKNNKISINWTNSWNLNWFKKH